MTFIHQFEYQGYEFRTVEGEYDYHNYKYFVMIGTNDEKCRIAYCYYADFDLDYIGTTEESEEEIVDKYMKKYFYWNDIAD